MSRYCHMMSSIKTTFFIATVFFLTACKTIPTTPDETPAPDPEQTSPSNTDSATQKTSPQNTSSNNSDNNKSEQNSGAQKEAASTDASANLTSEEQAQQLDQQLDERFADFDRLLLREREFLNEKQKEQGEPQNNGSTGAAGGEGLDGLEGLDGFDDIATDGSSSQNGNSSTQQTAGQNSYPSTNTNINTPPDLVNSKGDDVIARQLREAAQKEKDPVLREKLWDEYRKYKSGI